MSGALLFTQAEIEGLGIEWIKRTRVSPRAKIYNEIRVRFPDKQTRDYVASKRRLLASYVDPETKKPSAGSQMDIPEFLAHDYKILDDYGWRMRRAQGDKVRKYIKYEEASFSLVLELLIPGNDTWLRIPPSVARELWEVSEKEDIQKARTLLTARPYNGRHTTEVTMGGESANFSPMGPSRMLINQNGISLTNGPSLLPLAVRGPLSAGARQAPTLERQDVSGNNNRQSWRPSPPPQGSR